MDLWLNLKRCRFLLLLLHHLLLVYEIGEGALFRFLSTFLPCSDLFRGVRWVLLCVRLFAFISINSIRGQWLSRLIFLTLSLLLLLLFFVKEAPNAANTRGSTLEELLSTLAKQTLPNMLLNCSDTHSGLLAHVLS